MGSRFMTERQEFSKRTKDDAFARAAGRCERCATWLLGRVRYNHRIPCALGGAGDADNVEVLCLACDAAQTYGKDIPAIAKCRRIRQREAGIKKPRTITAWRRFDGSIVRAGRAR